MRIQTARSPLRPSPHICLATSPDFFSSLTPPLPPAAARAFFFSMSAKDKVHEAPRDEVEDSQASSGSRRKKKDPKAPKRPLSAYVVLPTWHSKICPKSRVDSFPRYNIYFKKIRQQLLDTQAPRLGFEALVKKVSAQWREVDTETRAVCEAEAKVDYERYFEEMKAYRARPDVRAALENPDAKGKRKFVGVPKRPLSGYTTYVQEEHGEHRRLPADPRVFAHRKFVPWS